jgi:hypothetical protein
LADLRASNGLFVLILLSFVEVLGVFRDWFFHVAFFKLFVGGVSAGVWDEVSGIVLVVNLVKIELKRFLKVFRVSVRFLGMWTILGTLNRLTHIHIRLSRGSYLTWLIHLFSTLIRQFWVASIRLTRSAWIVFALCWVASLWLLQGLLTSLRRLS